MKITYNNNLINIIKKVVIFCLLLLFVSELVNQTYISIVLSKSTLSRAANQFDKKRDKTSILIAGDSHPRSDVYPPIIPNSFNVATGGENIICTYYRLRRYIKDGMNIELVILPIDLHSFSSFRTDRLIDTYWWRNYINYFELGRIKGKLFEYFWIRVGGDFAYIGGIKNTINQIKIKLGIKEIIPIHDGHLAGNEDFSKIDDPVYTAKLRVNSHLKGEEIFDRYMVMYFFRTLDLLQQDDVKVVLVRYPISNAYYRMAEKVMDIDKYNQQVERMIEANGYYIPILDYQDSKFLPKSMFNDADHLNVNGAKYFTRMLKNDLMKLGVVSE